MISAVLIILLFLALSYLYGRLSLRLVEKIFGFDSSAPPPAAWIVLLGWVALTSLASVLSIWMPLRAGALGILLTGAGIIIWYMRRTPRFLPARSELQHSPIAWGLIFFVGLGILENATHLAANPDTGIYHAQAIRWIESYPAVPGLGNLHGRFAFNSSWLVTHALFSLSFLGLQSFRLVPAALVLVSSWIMIAGLAGWVRGESSAANILKTLLLPLFFYVAGSEISSPGTDLPVILLAWLLAAGWLERDAQPASFRVILFSLSIFALTLKLSAAPLMFLALWVLVARVRQKRPVWGWAALAGLILLPWVVRNYIYSGYPLYPVPGVPGIGLDWQIPSESVAAEQRAVLAWSRLPRMDRETVLAMPLAEWLPLWFQGHSLNRRLMLVGAALSPLILALEAAWAAWRQKSDRPGIARLLALDMVVYAAGLYWLLTAPDLRFGYGYTVLLLCLPLVYPLQVLSALRWKHFRVIPWLVALVILGYQAAFLAQSFDRKTLTQRIVFPLPYRLLPSEPCPIQNGVVLCAAEVSWSECWYDPFPCIPKPNPEVEMRSTDWSDGFRPSQAVF